MAGIIHFVRIFSEPEGVLSLHHFFRTSKEMMNKLLASIP